MLVHKRMLLETLGMATNVKALHAITIVLAGTQIVAETYRLSFTV